MMTLYEFRLLDAGGKVIITKEFKCATLQEAIGVSTTFSAAYHFVEIWSDGKAIGRLPKG
jgi:hypothetical protein